MSREVRVRHWAVNAGCSLCWQYTADAYDIEQPSGVILIEVYECRSCGAVITNDEECDRLW